MLDESRPAGSAGAFTDAESFWPWFPLPQLVDMSVLFSELYAGAAGVPVASVERAWREEYAPHVRVIDGVPAENDPRRREIAQDDPDDLAFADAVALMGPVLAFSEDTDLTARGLASDQWRDAALLMRHVMGADYAIGGTPLLSALLIGEAIKLARRHPEIALCVLLAGLAICGPYGPSAARLTRERAKAIGGAVLRGFSYVMQLRIEMSEQLAARLIAGSGNKEARAVAAFLARERQPIEVGRLASRLSASLDRMRLEKILVAHPAFVEMPAGWQLGRPAV
jgi:hypothetical protein